MTTASDLNALSFRSYLQSLIPHDDNFFYSLNNICIRFAYTEDKTHRVNSILNSVEQSSLLSVLENVETKRCPATGTCSERDQLVKLFISEESVLNKELVDIIQPKVIQTPDNIFHNYGVSYLFLFSFILNLYFIYKIIQSRLPAKRTRSKKFAHLKYILPIFFLACYMASYYKFYKETVASRLAASTGRDPCMEREWKISDFISGIFSVSGDKSDCQRFIESHVGWAFLDVNPLDPLLDIVGKILFGWISPLGHHLNSFYRRIVMGVPLAVQVIFLFILVLAGLSFIKYWNISLSRISFGSRPRREKVTLEETIPSGRLTWRTPSPEPLSSVRRTTRATARRTPAAKSRSRTRKGD